MLSLQAMGSALGQRVYKCPVRCPRACQRTDPITRNHSALFTRSERPPFSPRHGMSMLWLAFHLLEAKGRAGLTLPNQDHATERLWQVRLALEAAETNLAVAKQEGPYPRHAKKSTRCRQLGGPRVLHIYSALFCTNTNGH